MNIIELELDNNTAIIRLNNGKNLQDLVFAETLNEILDRIIQDETINAVILTSTDSKYFSIGGDIRWIHKKYLENDIQSIKRFMYGMNSVFRKILLFPVPVIAAINGPAVGNGAILSCACDFRFMQADKGYFCFPEINIDVPFLPGMIAIAQKAIPYQTFNGLYLSGRRMTAEEMEKSQIIEKACKDNDELMKSALEFAGSFSKKRKTFSSFKKKLHKHIIEIMDHEDSGYIERY